jgi:outer membrane protein assembly factor BamB
MNRYLSPVAGLLLAGASLALAACQAQPTAGVPAEAPSQATATPAPSGSVPGASASGLEVLWTFSSQGPIWGTPTVDNGTVYFGSDDGKLYAVGAQDGQPKWEFATEGIVRSRPALASGLVYIASDDGYLYALDAQSGEHVWHTGIGNALAREEREKMGTSPAPTGFDYFQSSPVVAEGQVYVGSYDGNVYALAADTGRVNWTYQTGGKVRATPTVAKGVVYVGSWDKSMYALSATTGKLLWQTPVRGQVQTTALVAGSLVYTASRKASVVALDVQTGAIVWEYDYGSNMWVESSPVLVDGVIYIGSSGSKMVVGLESETGKVVTVFFSHAFHWSTPAVVGHALYIGGAAFVGNDADEGGLYALELVGEKFADAHSGYRLLAVKDTLEPEGNWSGVASSPQVVDGVIYFGGLDGKLCAVR